MRVTGSLSPNQLDLGWGVLSAGCLTIMIAWPSWETIPFHLIWISLTLLYGFRVWSPLKTGLILGVVAIATGASIMTDAFDGSQLWGELFEVPLMSAMFLAMVWHARRRMQALAAVGALADERASMLEQEERLLHDVSHELRTPVTIARGHLELLARRLDDSQPELTVAFDELHRIEQIVERLLLLARAERDDFVHRAEVQLVPFLEDVFMRWAEVAPRAWRLGEVVDVTLRADETWLRAALDALLENAVHHTADYAPIELSARGEGQSVVIARLRRRPRDRRRLAGAHLRALRPLRRLTHAARGRRGPRPVDRRRDRPRARRLVHRARARSGRAPTFELRLPLPQRVPGRSRGPPEPIYVAVPGP